MINISSNYMYYACSLLILRQLTIHDIKPMSYYTDKCNYKNNIFKATEYALSCKFVHVCIRNSLHLPFYHVFFGWVDTIFYQFTQTQIRDYSYNNGVNAKIVSAFTVGSQLVFSSVKLIDNMWSTDLLRLLNFGRICCINWRRQSHIQQ